MSSPDPLKYVNSLELAEDHQQFENLPLSIMQPEADTEGRGFLNDRSVLTFHQSVPEQDRHDILNSLLLAQLAANKKFSDPEEILLWFQEVKTVLQNVGWQISEDKSIQHHSKGSLIEMHKSVAEMLVAAIGASFAGIVLQTIGAIKGLADDSGVIKVFQGNTHLGKNAGFQMGLAANEQSSTSLSLGAFKAVTEDKSKAILFFKSGKEHLKLNIRICQAKLHIQTYTMARETIKSILKKHVEKYITEINI